VLSTAKREWEAAGKCPKGLWITTGQFLKVIGKPLKNALRR
jgi:hypothetical protein